MSIENELYAYTSLSCPRLLNLIHELTQCKDIIMKALVLVHDKDTISEASEAVKEILILREKLRILVEKAKKKREDLEEKLHGGSK